MMRSSLDRSEDPALDATSAKTRRAFGAFREKHGPARLPPPAMIANAGECLQMNEAQGLTVWADGLNMIRTEDCILAPKLIEQSDLHERHLWVVRETDTAHALEVCDWGRSLTTGKIKHTNLTGGEAAFCGGELLFVDSSTVIINGCFGRYGPRSSVEMNDVAKAFSNSGYKIACMGFDEETDKPLPFVGTRPSWVG